MPAILQPRIEPQSPSSQSDAITIRPQQPLHMTKAKVQLGYIRISNGKFLLLLGIWACSIEPRLGDKFKGYFVFEEAPLRQ